MEAIAMTESPDVDPAKVVTHDPPQIVLSHDSPLTLLPYSQATGLLSVQGFREQAHQISVSDPSLARGRHQKRVINGAAFEQGKASMGGPALRGNMSGAP
ncbi:hypothetical protein CVIRNUC_008863 [Coccomyxa viridis]|uniref:Uncharacterized protein n=1 Tax=Coccomyxa viridis TaxID=1274662 RepID=A0AAV1IHH4_9CHLO|nr:hypothetical protein CVIRNUC_008863 [Coccomyxa viridis]